MNRVEICEVYYLIESDFNVGGWLHERLSNVRRGIKRGYVGESSGVQLSRMGFKPRPNLSYDTLTDDQKILYQAKCLEYGFTEQLRDIDSIRDIQALPQAILVDRDYDMLHILVSIGLIDSDDSDTDIEAWARFYNQQIHGLFVLLDESGADYLAVWGFDSTIPGLHEPLELLWLNDNLV